MTSMPFPRHPMAAERGFILVAVLWILAALAAFTAVYAVYVSDTASASAVRTQDLRAQGLAAAGVELAALRLLSVPPRERPVSGEVRIRMGGANVAVRFADEAARIDLNTAAPELLAALFQVLGAPEPVAKSSAASIAARRAPAPGSGGAGSGAVAGNGAPAMGDAAMRGEGSFAHTAELGRVPGLPPDLVAAALPHLTVYAGRREINPDLAGPVVRAALARAGQAADATLATPTGAADGESEGTGEGGDGSAIASTTGLTTAAGDTARVTVRIAFDDGRRHGTEAVILLRDFGVEPYRVLSWRELSWRELDEGGAAPAPPRRTTGGRP